MYKSYKNIFIIISLIFININITNINAANTNNNHVLRFLPYIYNHINLNNSFNKLGIYKLSNLQATRIASDIKWEYFLKSTLLATNKQLKNIKAYLSTYEGPPFKIQSILEISEIKQNYIKLKHKYKVVNAGIIFLIEDFEATTNIIEIFWYNKTNPSLIAIKETLKTQQEKGISRLKFLYLQNNQFMVVNNNKILNFTNKELSFQSNYYMRQLQNCNNKPKSNKDYNFNSTSLNIDLNSLNGNITINPNYSQIILQHLNGNKDNPLLNAYITCKILFSSIKIVFNNTKNGFNKSKYMEKINLNSIDMQDYMDYINIKGLKKLNTINMPFSVLKEALEDIQIPNN